MLPAGFDDWLDLCMIPLNLSVNEKDPSGFACFVVSHRHKKTMSDVRLHWAATHAGIWRCVEMPEVPTGYGHRAASFHESPRRLYSPVRK